MSIQPPSDIVLDVANAAGPISPAALAKLGSASSAIATNDMPFSNVLDGMGASKTLAPSTLPLFLPKAGVEIHSPKTHTTIFRDLEAVLLHSVVEAMLPKEAENVFGHGSAGNIWKSMMADQLAKDISKRLDLGLGKAAAGRTNYAGIFNSEHGKMPSLTGIAK